MRPRRAIAATPRSTRRRPRRRPLENVLIAAGYAMLGESRPGSRPRARCPSPSREPPTAADGGTIAAARPRPASTAPVPTIGDAVERGMYALVWSERRPRGVGAAAKVDGRIAPARGPREHLLAYASSSVTTISNSNAGSVADRATSYKRERPPTRATLRFSTPTKTTSRGPARDALHRRVSLEMRHFSATFSLVTPVEAGIRQDCAADASKARGRCPRGDIDAARRRHGRRPGAGGLDVNSWTRGRRVVNVAANARRRLAIRFDALLLTVRTGTVSGEARQSPAVRRLVRALAGVAEHGAHHDVAHVRRGSTR